MTKLSFPSLLVNLWVTDQQGFGTRVWHRLSVNLSASIFVLRQLKLIKGAGEKDSKEFLEVNKACCQQEDKRLRLENETAWDMCPHPGGPDQWSHCPGRPYGISCFYPEAAHPKLSAMGIQHQYVLFMILPPPAAAHFKLVVCPIFWE